MAGVLNFKVVTAYDYLMCKKLITSLLYKPIIRFVHLQLPNRWNQSVLFGSSAYEFQKSCFFTSFKFTHYQPLSKNTVQFFACWHFWYSKYVIFQKFRVTSLIRVKRNFYANCKNFSCYSSPISDSVHISKIL